MKVNKDVLIAYERLKQNDLFSTVKKTLFQMILSQQFFKFDANVVSIFSFKKHAFVDRVFTLMLVYRKQSLGVQEFSQIMQCLQQYIPYILQGGTPIMIF